MADVQHASITDPDIHEPKGILQATINSVYVADGAGSGEWRVLPTVDPSLISAPIGCVVPWPATSLPTGWGVLIGSAISRITYADLFAIIGITYGPGNGSTTFNLPDMRGCAIAGWDTMGGVSGNRLTPTSLVPDGDTIGARNGAQTITLTAGHLPVWTGNTNSSGAHTHPVSNGTIYRAGSGIRALTAGTGGYDSYDISISGSTGDHSHTVSVNTGGGGSHPNVQPTISMNYIMKLLA